MGASWEEPWIAVVVVGGAAVELMVSAIEAMVSAMEARSLASTLTGANFEEPCITTEVEGGAVP